MKKTRTQTYPLMQTDGGLSFAILMIGYILLAFFIQAVLLIFTTDTSSTLFVVVNSLVSPLAMLLVIVYQIKGKGRSVSVLSLNKFNKLHLLTALLLSIGMFLGLGFVNVLFADFLSGIGLNAPSPNIPLNNPFELILFSITVALFPAVFEELFFRGILLNSLKGENLLVRVFTVGLCFALYHCSVSQFVYQFIYGVAFCLLAIVAKSVIPCIIAHFINNFTILLFTYLNIDVDLTNILLIVIGVVALIGYFLISYFGLKGQKQQVPKKGVKFFYLPYGLFGIGICLIVLLGNLFG